MTTANVLVRPGFDINLKHLEIFGKKFAEVALYTTPDKGVKVIDATAHQAQPNHLENLDIMVVINSTVGLMEDEVRIQRQLDVSNAIRWVYPRARVGTYIILSTTSNNGQGYYVGEIGVMTMSAATLRAQAEINELAGAKKAS